MLLDTHAHINFEMFDNDLEGVIKRALANNTYFINVGSNYETSQKAVEIAKKYESVWAVIGCHPNDLSKSRGIEQEVYKKLAKSSSKVVGIGEVGLDFFKLADEAHPINEIKKIQIETFKQFIKLAKELNLPLVLHCRGEEGKNYEAYDLMLDILSSKFQAPSSKSNGVIHCFGGNLEQAKKFIDLGFYIGFTGIVTFKNANELQQIAKEIPLKKILIETDSPFLAPVPMRGKVNEPSYVRYVAAKIAELKGLEFEEVENKTFANAKKLFNI